MNGAKHVTILFSDNLLAIFDLARRTAVFKAKYNDATDNISHLYFIRDSYLEATDTTLMGFFLLVETKLVQKDSQAKRSASD